MEGGSEGRGRHGVGTCDPPPRPGRACSSRGVFSPGRVLSSKGRSSSSLESENNFLLEVSSLLESESNEGEHGREEEEEGRMVFRGSGDGLRHLCSWSWSWS